MKNFKIIIILAVGMVIFASCKKFDQMLNNPSTPAPETANVDLYMNAAQLSFANFYANRSTTPGLNDNGSELMRMEYLFAQTYLTAYGATAQDGAWRSAYQGVFKSVDALTPIAAISNRHLHIGMGRVLKAYVAATLVDFFGDVPYSEANKGAENTNPKPDPGKQVYDSVFALLDSAISSFNKVTSSTPLPTNDLFYSGAATARAGLWRRAAKTLKLKLYNQIRLVDNTVKGKIDALIADGELITTNAQAFVYRYGSKDQNPDSRHPTFATYYTGTGANDYLGNHFMYMVYADKGEALDPRWRYYFYRQVSTVTTISPSILECVNSSAPPHYPANIAFCYGHSKGFYGRDHGNTQGLPPDGFIRTVWGIYPVGGKFDNNDFTGVKATDGGQGQGILPLWQPAFTDFVRAEAALMLGTAGNPRTLLESGVRKSIATVMAFPATISVTIPAGTTPTTTAIDAYVAEVLKRYDAAATNADKLDVIMTEYYIALWGNGIEAYNNYRRTGMPRKMQPNLNPTPGPFLRSLFYPATFTERNSNVTQKTTTNVKVFWDNNPDNIFVN